GSGPLIVRPEANSLAVEFSSSDFSAPERNRFAFRLEGYDRDWIAADPSHRLATYANLPPGDYRLHLRASNRDGQWGEQVL
ncbi:triple tyrosine motif-containing protein, partial [Acinetobacter baumannii]